MTRSEQIHHDPAMPNARSVRGIERSRNWCSRGGVRIALILIRLYQWTLSPLLGGQCRFEPTCSRYAADAFQEHGVVRGTRLTVGRLLRCHPLCRGGYDPVPPLEHGSGEPGASGSQVARREDV